jgi:hypothetical protein
VENLPDNFDWVILEKITCGKLTDEVLPQVAGCIFANYSRDLRRPERAILSPESFSACRRHLETGGND